jgi:hypothetical protein
MEVKKVFYAARYSTAQILFDNLYLYTQGQYELVDNYEECDIMITYDMLCNQQISRDKEYILIRSEPEVVLPQNYKERNLKMYKNIFDVGKLNDGLKKTINSPQNLDMRYFDKTNRDDKIVLVNSNLLSLRRGEMYSLRRKAIYGIDDLVLYGRGWNSKISTRIKTLIIEVKNVSSNPTRLEIKKNCNYFYYANNYLGAPLDKILCMSNYKYALVIENSMDYISEKLFDAFISGCIPVYVGVNPQKFGIPENLYFYAEPNLDSVLLALSLARKSDFEVWQASCKNWLESESTISNWSVENFALNLTNLIFNQ